MIICDIFFTYYRPFLLVHLYRQIVYLILGLIVNNYDFSSYNSILNILNVITNNIHFIIAISLYYYMDTNLQIYYIQNQKSDLKLMKVIHDLKNPVISCRQTVNDKDMNPNKTRDICNQELEDLEDMLENLRTEFKVRNLMDLKEQPRQLMSEEFLLSLKNSNSRLAYNGNNKLTIETSENFPIELKLQKLNTKRIVNNLISNSLKHTNNGYVTVYFSILNSDELNLLDNDDLITVGKKRTTLPASFDNLVYLKIDVIDNGRGIPAEFRPYIFLDTQSDQCDDNWDGTGLGLSICVQLCKQMDAFIMYGSQVGVGSQFSLYVPIHKNKGMLSAKKMSLTINSEQEKLRNMVKHVCNEVYFAEDNPNILNKYEKLMKKYSIPYMIFSNGLSCLKYIKSLSCSKCSKSLLFTDMNMPYLDGLNLAIQIRDLEAERKFEIILVSAEEFDNNLNYFNLVYNKPIIPKKIIEICCEYNGDNYLKNEKSNRN
eukprot:Mrub_02517.p1 GENE.Mrub_02517~~Mrub_02517.p1  ORF type:complete len:543 (+),score=68.92 Mrub_02517:173-1630(+)